MRGECFTVNISDNYYVYKQRFTDNSYGYAQKFTDNSPFFLIFSDFLLNYLIFSDFLVFSSYICTRKSAARKKGCGVIIFMKVLKND